MVNSSGDFWQTKERKGAQMSRNVKFSIVMLAVMLLIAPHALARGKSAGGGGYAGSSLSVDEQQGLLQMREEEKLARDVYLYLYDLWGQPIFQNIAASEQRHMDAVLRMINKSGLQDPAAGNKRGIFTDPDMQLLYDTLTQAGNASQAAALRVGATVEDLDIYDLQALLTETDNQDLTRVYLNLMKGSRNHLRAFAGQLELLGESYAAQYLSQEEVDDIINSPMEKGRY
jgi:hypothetical protein